MKYLYVIISFLGIFALTSRAQEKTMTDTVHNIKEIEIVARIQAKNKISKLNVPTQYMPITINAVDGKVLDIRGINSIPDAVKLLPGTRIRTTYGAYQQFSVRGYDYTPIMIDGIRDERTSINNSTPLPDLSSTETLELIKGPASVLYGHSIVGGLLNVVRKAPTSQTTVNTNLRYGSWKNKQALMEFGGNIYKSLNYIATINYSDVEGYRYTNNKRFSGYLALGAQIDSKQYIEFRGGFMRDEYGTEIGQPPFMTDTIYNVSDNKVYLNKGEQIPGLNRRWRYNNESDFMYNRGTNFMLKYSFTGSEAIKIENRLAYTHDVIDYFSTEELSYLTSDLPIYDRFYYTDKNKSKKKYINLDSVQLTYPLRFAYTVDVINEDISASGKISFDNDMKIHYNGGYNFVVMFRDRYRGYGGGKPLTDFIDGPGLYSKVPVYNPHSMGYMDPHFGWSTITESYTHGAYLQALFELSEKLKVMAAGRFDYFEYKTAEGKETNREKRKYYGRNLFQKVHSTAFTYRLGAVYLPIKDLSFYGSLANLYMPYRDIADTEKYMYADSDGNRFYPKTNKELFKPQTGYQAELGTQYNWGRYLQATASVYYIRKNNEKMTSSAKYADPDGGDNKQIVGIIGSSESKGFEIELKSNPIRNLYLSAGYAYTNAKTRKATNIQFVSNRDSDSGLNLEKGTRLANAPVNTFFSAGDYTISSGVFRNLSFNYTVSFMDKVHRDLTKNVIYPSYWLTDLGVSYRLNNGIGVALNVNNVFDKKYYNQSLNRQMVPSDPRSYLVTISYSLR